MVPGRSAISTQFWPVSVLWPDLRQSVMWESISSVITQTRGEFGRPKVCLCIIGASTRRSAWSSGATPPPLTSALA